MSGPDKPSGKNSGRSWWLILFSLPFLGVSLGMLAFGVVPTLYDWSRMQSWVPVEAVVTAAELKIHRGDDATTYRATATYAYHYAGVDYRGSRVAIGSSADNIGDFQQSLGRRLESAARRETPVTIWVDPGNPAQAVVDRSLRPGLLFFKLIFVFVFGLVGGGLLIYQLFFSRRQQLHVTPQNTDKPWLQRTDWADNHIGCTHKTQLWFAWGFALLWNLVSAPVAFVIPAEVGKGNYPILIALLFPLVGAGLLWWAFCLTRDWRRYGAIFLQMDPFPGSIGGQVGGTIELSVTYDPALRFGVTLNCIYSYVSGSGKNRSTRQKSVWQSEGIATIKSHSSGVRLQFLFDVPDNLPASEPEEMPYHSWRVDIKSRSPQLNLSRQFTVPVYNTGQASRYIRENSAQHPELVTQRLDELETICQFSQVPEGVEMFFPIFRNWKAPLMGLIFGGIFAGAGIAIGYNDGPFIFPLVFGGIGIIVIWTSLDALFNSRQVRLDADGYKGRKWWLGIPVGSRYVPRAQLRKLRIKESYSTNSGNEFSTVYKILLELDSGKTVRVADSLRGEATARQLAESISLYSGVPLQQGIAQTTSSGIG